MQNNPLPGRALTPEQKRAIIERLYTAWLKAPTLRLGQLIYASNGLHDLFFVEDETLIASVEQCILIIEEENQQTISFTCSRCGTNLVIRKYMPESIASGTFCSKCDKQYWINWSEGVLRNDDIALEQQP